MKRPRPFDGKSARHRAYSRSGKFAKVDTAHLFRTIRMFRLQAELGPDDVLEENMGSLTLLRDDTRGVLTDRQREILEFISQSIRERGYPPTLREIGVHFGIRSTNGVNDHLRALEKKGHLQREDLKSRALRPVGAPSSSSAVGQMGVR